MNDPITDEAVSLLELDKIEAWAASFPPTSTVGKRNRLDCCPLANYLKGQGMAEPSVGAEYLFVGPRSAPRVGRRHSKTITALIKRIDAGGRGESRVRAATLLRLVRAQQARQQKEEGA